MRRKTATTTPFGVFCYVKMPFNLKNSGATYQRCIQNCMQPQIGRNVEAYIDDIVVKSRTRDSLVDDLKETFDNLRKYHMMLNPKKCMFGVSSSKLLEFLVSSRGIKANPSKIEALDQMRSPRTLKEVQKLTGCIAALS